MSKFNEFTRVTFIIYTIPIFPEREREREREMSGFVVFGVAVVAVAIRRFRSLNRRKLRVHVFPSTYRNDAERREALRKRIEDSSVGVELSFGPDIVGDGVDVVVVKKTYEFCVDKIRKLSRVPRFAIVPYAGPPRTLLDKFSQLDNEIQVFNSNHNAPSTAEMAIALLLSASKNVIRGHQELSNSNWLGRGMYPKTKGEALEKPIPQMYLNRKTAVVVGLGSVGRHVAKVLRCLGMRVIGTRRNAKIRDRDGFEIWTKSLVELFKHHKPKVIMLCVPGTPETVNLIRSKELNALPDDCVLVNMARGQVVNEKSIYEHLKSNPRFSYAADVWWCYPTVDDDPSHFAPCSYDFAKLKNTVVMSPHRGGGIGVDEIEDERFNKIADLLTRIGSGRVLPRCVNLKLGY